MKQENQFQILSLDGGGIKGIFAASVLAAMEEDLGINICDHFDLIAGTSTGGIIAIGLGLGMRPREIVEFYLNHGKAIFPQRYLIHQLFRSKYSPEPLENALKECFQDKRFGESKKRLVIPAYDMDNDKARLFRTPHLERLRRDRNILAREVARATSAAPTYFPVSKTDSTRMIDGGVWANNPTLVAIVEALQLEYDIKSLKVLNVGTFEEVTHRHHKLNLGGLIAWRNDIVDIIMRGQNIGVYNQAKFLLGKENVLRISPNVPPDIFKLDKVSNIDEIISKARSHSMDTSPLVKDMFLSHVAKPYTPFHS